MIITLIYECAGKGSNFDPGSQCLVYPTIYLPFRLLDKWVLLETYRNVLVMPLYIKISNHKPSITIPHLIITHNIDFISSILTILNTYSSFHHADIVRFPHLKCFQLYTFFFFYLAQKKII